MTIKDVLLIPVVLIAALCSDLFALVLFFVFGVIAYCFIGGIISVAWEALRGLL